jgi:transposase
VVIVSSADDLAIGACLCGANQQDATFAADALRRVAELPVEKWAIAPPIPKPIKNKKASGAERRKIKSKLFQAANGVDLRALPYTRGDGNFAKDPTRLGARDAGYRLWAPKVGQSRRGLGRVRSSVERAHAFLNQFGRIARRLDRHATFYLGWVHLACCLIFMRRGFFP